MTRARTAVVLTLALLAGQSWAESNVVANPGFEEVNDGLPASWTTDSYLGETSPSKFGVGQDGAYSGERYATIEASIPDDAKIVQRVAVRPNALYRISCWIRAERCGPEGLGANVSALGIVETSEDFRDTGGEWRLAAMFGRTGPSQTSLVVAVRLGGYGRLNSGSASFDELQVVAVPEAPAGVSIADLAPADPAAVPARVSDAPSLLVILLIAAAAVLAGLVAVRAFRGRPQLERSTDDTERATVTRLLWLFLGVAALVRLVVAAVSPGLPNDVATFASWATELAQRGIPGFYSRVSFCDYPPGYLYVLALIGLIAKWLGLGPSSPAFLFLLRLPALAADIILCVLVYRVGSRTVGIRRSAVLAALLAASPALVVNSALWGQVDSVLALLVVLALLAMRRRRLLLSTVLCALAVLVKPMGLVCAPILLGELIRRRDPKRLALGVLAGVAAVAVAALPFAVGQGPLWLVSLYTRAMGSYPYATINAANLYGFLGGNWVSETQGVFFVSFRVTGYVFLAAILAGATLLTLRARSLKQSRSVLVGLLVSLGVFTLAHEMHERYLLVAFVLCLFSYATTGDRRLLAAWAGIGAILFVNQALVLDLALRRGTYQISQADPLFRLLSLAEVLLFAVVLRIGLYMALRPPRRRAAEVPLAATAARELGGGRPGLESVDRVALLLLTAVASALAFVGLGSTRSPQTFSTAEQAGELAVADMGAERYVKRVSAFVGLGQGAYLLELSRDGVEWTQALRVEQESIFGMIEWRVADPSMDARYLRVTSERPGLALGEIGLFDEALGRLPLKLIEPGARAAAYLFDEQELTVAVPSYRNGTYFDEVYFARSAYEGIVGIEPTETSHPPLGKLIMALGIRIFGMTPFGWRFMGALASVLVVPLGYLFARRLFGGARSATIAALLLLFDFMRFVQGRMATVDSFVLLFVLLGAYCLYRFWELDLLSDRGSAWLWLAAAGASLGAGAACKWIAAYALPGMLLVLGSSFRRHFQAYRSERPAAFTLLSAEYLAWGLVCALMVPLAVYGASYLPMIARHGRSMAEVVMRQAQMWSYHAGVSETRWYASQWWEWPLVARPIWLYAGVDVPAGRVSSIVTMGNPAVWWIGFAGVIAASGLLWWRREPAGVFPLLAFLCQYLPWLVVPRTLQFIYHFLSAVPFMILTLVYVGRRLARRYPGLRPVGPAFVAIVVVLFALFYPILTGVTVPEGYVRLLRWFPSWIFSA